MMSTRQFISTNFIDWSCMKLDRIARWSGQTEVCVDIFVDRLGIKLYRRILGCKPCQKGLRIGEAMLIFRVNNDFDVFETVFMTSSRFRAS